MDNIDIRWKVATDTWGFITRLYLPTHWIGVNLDESTDIREILYE